MNLEPDFSTLSPAKINLFLHVIGRRDDGYHMLQTAFRLLDYGDLIEFKVRRDGQINRTSELPGVPAEADLVVRAAQLLQLASGSKLGVDIAVTKRLPLGGGLGGGSSNAACVLLALNRLWNIHAPRLQLQNWGLALGADVPFFIFGRDAFAEGIGETLQVIDLPPKWYVVVEPPAQVSTPEIFTAKELTRNNKPVRMPAFVARYAQTQAAMRDAVDDAQFGNDLQKVACAKYPIIASAMQALDKHNPNPKYQALMSGSGACVFLTCDDEVVAKNIAHALKPDWKTWVAPTLMRHPLYEFCCE